jgi:hypothetical protein
MKAQGAPLLATSAVLAVASCSRAPVVPDGAASDAAPFAQPAPTSVPSSRPSSPEAGVAEPASIVLPRHEDACTTDGECGVTSLDVAGPTVCCFRCCSMQGGRKQWTDAVEAICKSAPGLTCSPVACACPSPPYQPKCIEGRCGLVYPRR